MPSWTAAQNEPVQNATQPHRWAVAGTQNRLQRFLGIRSSPIELSSGMHIPIALQHSNQSNLVGAGGRTASSPLLARVAPRFRPTRNGYGTGQVETHPLHHAGHADSKSDAIPAMPRMQASSPPLSSRSRAPPRALKTVSRYKSRQDVAGHPQISAPGTFGSPRAGRGHEEVPTQCPHRRGFRVSLRSLN
jgi:hypothetical protein